MLSLVKVVFPKETKPIAPIEVRATDAEGQNVGQFEGFFTYQRIVESVSEVDEPLLLTSERSYVHGVLIGGFNLDRPGEYVFSWYLNGILQRTSTMNIYLPDEIEQQMGPG